MAKRELKTKPEKASVAAFLDGIEDDGRRKDCKAIARLMQKATGSKPQMWGTAIVGFGNRTYHGRSGSSDWFEVGFSPRKQNLTLYLMGGFVGNEALVKRLGKHGVGKGCLYLKSLDDVDAAALEQLIVKSVKRVKESKS
jgi:hypothetical protein